MTRLALIVPALLASTVGIAEAKTLSGNLPGAPARSWGAAATVEAISAHDGSVRGAVRARGTHWSMSVPSGHYIVAAVVSDSTAGTTTLVDAHLASAAAAASGGTIVGIGDVPIVPAAGSGFGQGGTATGGLVTGMLPSCNAKKGKLVDRTQEAQDAINREQSLSDQGRTPFKLQLQPLQPTVTVSGKVTLSNDSATVDVRIADARTGRLIKHVVVRGDSTDFNQDLGSFLTFAGRGIGALACQKPKAKPKPKPKPKGGRPTFTVEYSGVYDDDASDSGNVHVNDVHMTWDEVLSGSVSRSGTISAKPMKLTLSGDVTIDNNTQGFPSHDVCSLTPGSIPVLRGGFINLQRKGSGGFEAWASIPQTLGNGVIGYAPGSPAMCMRGDLAPFSGLPPDSWNAVSLATVDGRWRTPIAKAEKTSFTLSGGYVETVTVNATLRVVTSGTLPKS